MTLLLSLIGLLYVGSMLFYSFGFLRMQGEWDLSELDTEAVDFTVVVPFRNESAHIAALVDSLKKAHRPLYAHPFFIFVNDHSTDDSLDTLEEALLNFPYKYILLSSKGEGKKAALETGIAQAQTSWIVTTDADVSVNPLWLQTLSSVLFHSESDLLVLPVNMKGRDSLLDAFQALESKALVSMGIGSLANGVPLTANGANLAFKKEAFYRWGAYRAESHTPSGDDEFLLKRAFAMQSDKVKACALREIMVDTHPANGMQALINQRLRWASKINSKKLSPQLLLSAIGLVFMLCLFFSMVSAFLVGNWKIFITCLSYKIIGDGLLFISFRRFFGLSKKHLLLLLGMPFYQIVYMIGVAIKRSRKTYEWKERKYTT
jgi:biofilm PGA synthesis N-glycosyltransferase PgaC